MRIINFQPNRCSASPSFKNCKILKLKDNINIQNFLFAHDSIKNNLPIPLLNQLFFVDTGHDTRNEDFYQLKKPPTRTITYGTNSIKSKSVEIWNTINRHHFNKKLHEKSRASCMLFAKKYFIDQY